METSDNGFSAGAEEHAWRPLIFPLAPFLFYAGRGRGNEGWLERKQVDTLSPSGHMGTGTCLMRNLGF